MISLYDSECTDFDNNGLVVLSDTISCIVTEELNGMFELTLEYPLDVQSKWTYLVEENIIKADGQLFRIYRKLKTLTSIQVNARHIFYDLLENICMDARIGGQTGARALEWMLDDNTLYAHPFTNASDVGGDHNRFYTRRNPVDIIMNPTDGIIATWGGELIRDNFLIELMSQRGLDRGVLISYGKNIQGIEETLDTTDVCTRLVPVGTAEVLGSGVSGLLLPEVFLDSPYLSNYPYPKIRVQEFNDIQASNPVNLFDTETAILEHDVVYSTGEVREWPNYFASDLIQVSPSTHYIKSGPDTVAFYDYTCVYISGLAWAPDFTTPANCYYVRIVDQMSNLYTATLLIDEAELTAIAISQLREAGQNYLDSGIDIPKCNYKIDFLELSKTEEYKNYAVLERVYMGDTVTIRHARLGIDLKARVIKITKNCLLDRIEKVELGSFRSNIASSINGAIEDVKNDITTKIAQTTSAYQNAMDNFAILYQAAINNATSLITGATGGHVLIRTGDDGKPYEILIMDTDDVMTAEKVWRWNLGGFGYSSTGINGPFETAITMDGSIVAKFLTGLELTAAQINAVELATLNISGTINAGNTLEIGPPNETGGQCHFNTAEEGFRAQAHTPEIISFIVTTEILGSMLMTLKYQVYVTMELQT
jgi:phage minor structural protein